MCKRSAIQRRSAGSGANAGSTASARSSAPSNAAGLVLREVDEGPPVAVRYRLSDHGAALVPVLRDLMSWARDHLPLQK